MKKICILLSVLLACLTCPAATAHAAAPGWARVNVRVEGAERTLATGTVAAYTFREALEELAAASNLTLTFIHSGGESTLSEVHDTSELNDINNGQWQGYVIRGDQIVRQDDFLNLPVKNGDEAVLYLGTPETKIVTHFSCEQDEDILRFFVGTSETSWTEDNGNWIPVTTVTPAEGASVHVVLPHEAPVTLLTGSDGYCEIPLINSAPLGMVQYWAEGYYEDGTPLIVRTSKRYKPYGFASGDTATRAEAVAFMTHMYALENDRVLAVMPFTDVNEETRWFDEIAAAVERGLVAGYEDKTFRPDTPIDLMQLCVLTARLFPALYDEGSPLDGLPSWAADATGGLYHAGMLTGIGTEWTQNAPPDVLIKLYLNVTGLF